MATWVEPTTCVPFLSRASHIWYVPAVAGVKVMVTSLSFPPTSDTPPVLAGLPLVEALVLAKR